MYSGSGDSQIFRSLDSTPANHPARSGDPPPASFSNFNQFPDPNVPNTYAGGGQPSASSFNVPLSDNLPDGDDRYGLTMTVQQQAPSFSDSFSLSSDVGDRYSPSVTGAGVEQSVPFFHNPFSNDFVAPAPFSNDEIFYATFNQQVGGDALGRSLTHPFGLPGDRSNTDPAAYVLLRQPQPVSYPRVPWMNNDSSGVQFGSVPTDTTLPHIELSHHRPPPLAPHFQGLSAPILTNDGYSTLPAGSEEVPALGEPLFFTDPGHSFTGPSPLPALEPGAQTQPNLEKCREIKFIPYPHQSRSKLKGRAIARGATHPALPIAPSKSLAVESGQFKSQTSGLGPWAYDEENRTHKKIVKLAKESVTRSALNDCSLLEESERKQQLQDALSVAASRYADKESAATWAILNHGAVYKAFPPPSGKITSTCKKFARALVQSGYSLRPSAWSNDSEPEHQKKVVKYLMDESVFPPRYILGKDESQRLGICYAFEHEVVWDVVLNTVLELDLQSYLVDSDNLFCTAAVAVHCALLERSDKGLQHVEFAVSDSKPMYNRFRQYIREHIAFDVELFKRWVEYKERTSNRLASISSSR